MSTGKINVHTENIFPIIKKFLYSDHEIFIRELVSNAVDASQKLKALAQMGEFNGELGDLTIDVECNKENKTIIIRDKGIGMQAEEIEKYITQIAFSGAEEFVQKYKDKTDAATMIGHFGLGFYSAFMVASKVEINSLSYKNGSEAAHWVCDGSPEYTIGKSEKKDRGTEIILHIGDDNLDFLENAKIEGLLNKYCRFLPVSIRFGKKTESVKEEGTENYKSVEVDNIINNTSPAWTKKPIDLKEEDYKNFYRELYPIQFEEPLFHIHLNVDYPFNLTGVLYFPRLTNRLEVPKDKIQLYCNQVFVTDNVEQIVPDFLTLLRGVIDSPDIPLNVSRSYLQADANVKKISGHIVKKVSDKLEELFKKDRSEFEKKWEDLRIFVIYGMLSDEKFYEKALKFCLFKNTEGKYFTIEEYREKIKSLQTDKENKVIHLYANDAAAQFSYTQSAKEKAYDVLLMDGPLDSHFINHLEGKLSDVRFTRVDSDVIDKLIQKDENIPSKLSDDEKNKLKPIIEKNVAKEKFQVVFENLSETDQPMIVTQPEFMRRMKEMNNLGGGASFYGNLPEMYNLVINTSHPIIGKILSETDEQKQDSLIRQTSDLALLSKGLLNGQELSNFIQRSLKMIQ